MMLTFDTGAALFAAIAIAILLWTARADLRRFWNWYRGLAREGQREPSSVQEWAERQW